MKFAFTLALGLAASSAAAQASPSPETRPCVRQNDTTFRCNPRLFRRVLDASQTVAFDTDPDDRAAQRNLKALAAHLHKQVVEHQDAQLVFALHAINSNGIVIGPGDNELARLDVLRAGHNGQPDELIWSETYTGDAEKPWALIVNALAEQFEDSAKHH